MFVMNVERHIQKLRLKPTCRGNVCGIGVVVNEIGVAVNLGMLVGHQDCYDGLIFWCDTGFCDCG